MTLMTRMCQPTDARGLLDFMIVRTEGRRPNWAVCCLPLLCHQVSAALMCQGAIVISTLLFTALVILGARAAGKNPCAILPHGILTSQLVGVLLVVEAPRKDRQDRRLWLRNPLLTHPSLSTAHQGRVSTNFDATMTTVSVWLFTMSPMSLLVFLCLETLPTSCCGSGSSVVVREVMGCKVLSAPKRSRERRRRAMKSPGRDVSSQNRLSTRFTAAQTCFPLQTDMNLAKLLPVLPIHPQIRCSCLAPLKMCLGSLNSRKSSPPLL